MDSSEKNTEANIPPVQLNENSTFKFKCHKGVSCFTQCCRGINIMLTPYDIIRIKNRMQISSEEFLAVYTKPELLEKTDLPVVTLKLLDDEQESCPFVRDDGCLIYEDRPTTCRYYPLGVASLSYKEKEKEGFYFFINEPHCKGFEEDRQWTVRQWRKDQGVDIHDDINAEWTELIVRKRSIPKNIRLTEKTKNMFFTASYDIDRFKRFVFESTFLDLYEIDDKTIEDIRSDEIALLRFSFRWLKWLLFKEGGFAIDEAKAAKRQERVK
ncbi:MAG: YkgJ family cysteine cluster protein [Dissulfuribacterales bacterium]